MEDIKEQDISALDRQVDGSHYKTLPIQPIQFGEINQLTPLQTKIVKYLSRYKNKHGRRDLETALHCAELMLEMHSINWIADLPLLSPPAIERLQYGWAALRSKYAGTSIRERYQLKQTALGSHIYTAANDMDSSIAAAIILVCEEPTASHVRQGMDQIREVIRRDYPDQHDMGVGG